MISEKPPLSIAKALECMEIATAPGASQQEQIEIAAERRAIFVKAQCRARITMFDAPKGDDPAGTRIVLLASTDNGLLVRIALKDRDVESTINLARGEGFQR